MGSTYRVIAPATVCQPTIPPRQRTTRPSAPHLPRTLPLASNAESLQEASTLRKPHLPPPRRRGGKMPEKPLGWSRGAGVCAPLLGSRALPPMIAADQERLFSATET